MREIVRNPIGLIRESILRFRRDDGLGVSAETAYRLVISLPALVIVSTSVSSIAAQYTGVDAFQQLLDRAREGLPIEVYSTLELILTSIEEQSGITVLAIGLVIALWSGSSAIAALVKGINRAHGVEDVRGVLRRCLIALALLIGLGLLMITSFALLLFGDLIRSELGSAFGLGDEITLLWNIARWPLTLLLFMGALAILFWAGPARSVDRRAMWPGAVIATLLWLIVSYAFSVYLAVVDPESAYGVVGSIIALMLFLYFSSIVIIFGAQINATIRRRIEGGLVEAESVDHPVDVMSDRVLNSSTYIGSRIATWAVVGGLICGALLAGLLRRESKDNGSPDSDL